MGLARYIELAMPDGAPAVCDAKCSEDIAAYMRSWSPVIEPIACDTSGEFHYGRRQMRLLTSTEYTNSLADLVAYNVDAQAAGVPSNTTVESFYNQVFTPVTQAHLDAYVSVADAAATFAESNNFAGIVDCAALSSTQCGEKFVNEFAPKVYRRALSSDEKTRFQALFANSLTEGNVNEGLKLAIRSALSSPYFLYRSEMGQKVSDIIDQIDNGEAEYRPGQTSLVLEGASLGTTAGEYKVINLYQNYGVSTAYNFTGKDLITIKAKGEMSGGAWPTMRLQVDNNDVDLILVDSADERSFSFFVDGVTGANKYVQVVNDLNGADHTEGRGLSIMSMSFANAEKIERPRPDANLDNDAYVLTQYELATFLAYTYTGTTPDSALLAAAAADELLSDAQIRSQISRLLATDKAKNHFADFASQWFKTDSVLAVTKSASDFPDFTPSIRQAMAKEVREIFKHVMFDDQQPVTNLYSNMSFMNKELADFYGVAGVTGNNFVKVNNLNNRGGVLASGAFMTSFAHEKETAPIIRAVRVRENLLCQKVPPMPTDIALERDDAAAALAVYIQEQGGSITNRQRYAFLTKDEPCSQCHDKVINPHGFGMEDFDAVGRIRTMDANNLSIDASGELHGTYTLNDGDVKSFQGVHQFSGLLESLPAAKECFTQKSFRYVMGIGHDVFDHVAADAPELSTDEKGAYSCALDAMNTEMNSANSNAKAAFTALGVRDIVRYRKAR